MGNKAHALILRKQVGNMSLTKEGVTRLSIAIIKSACDDYRTGKDSKVEFEKFCRSPLFTLLTNIQPDYLIEKMKIEREEYINAEEERVRRYSRKKRL